MVCHLEKWSFLRMMNGVANKCSLIRFTHCTQPMKRMRTKPKEFCIKFWWMCTCSNCAHSHEYSDCSNSFPIAKESELKADFFSILDSQTQLTISNAIHFSRSTSRHTDGMNQLTFIERLTFAPFTVRMIAYHRTVRLLLSWLTFHPNCPRKIASENCHHLLHDKC